jgi:hypothetical protein
VKGLGGSVGLTEALRAVQRKASAIADRDWDLVASAIASCSRRYARRGELDVILSCAFVRLRTTESAFRGQLDAEAVVFLQRVVRSVVIDERRKEQRDRLRLVRAPEHGDDIDPIATLAAPEPDRSRTLEAEYLLERTKDRLRGYIDRVLEGAQLGHLEHQTKAYQAESCVLALLERKSSAEIRVILATTASPATVHKWTERGRPFVLDALTLWAASADEDDAPVIAKLREIFEKRRADAGKARPSRRKPPPASHIAGPDGVSPEEDCASEQYVAPPRPQKAARRMKGGPP